MILSDRDIRSYIDRGELIISPLTEDTVRENGVDLRIGDVVGRLIRSDAVFDLERDDPSNFIRLEKGDNFIVYPYEHILLHTIEYIKMPRDLMAFVNIRSSFARLGLSLPPTIVDANFEGQLTIGLIGGNFPIRLYKNMRFLHLVFGKLMSPVDKAYEGKYQGQRGIQVPIFKKPFFPSPK